MAGRNMDHATSSASSPRSAGLSASVEPLDDGLRAEWDELARTTADPPFVRPGWVSPAWDCSRPPQRERNVVVARRGRGLVAVLPVLTAGRSLISPAHRHSPWGAPVAADEEALEAALQQAARLPVVCLDLGCLPADTAAVVASWAGRSGYLHMQSVTARRPHIDTTVTWRDMLARLPASRRKSLRHNLRQLRRHGDVTFLAPADLDGDHRSLVDEGFAIEERSWKGTYCLSVNADPTTRAFYDAVSRWAAAEGMLRISLLRVDGRAVAYSYDLLCGGTMYGVRTAFDPAFRSSAPGLLLMHALVEWCCVTDDVQEYDFGGGPDPYKMIWATGTKPAHRVQIFTDRLAPVRITTAKAVASARTRTLAVLPREVTLHLLRLRSLARFRGRL
jgi:CelD/BcsL family acetyltransferase involved in cellulose biosynthesis